MLDVFDAEYQASVEGDGEDSQAEVAGGGLYPGYLRQFDYFHIENRDKDRKFCLLPKSKKYSWCESRATSQRYRDKGTKAERTDTS